MTDKRSEQEQEPAEEMSRRIAADERRKLRARSRPEQSAWFGLGMFGLVGWSVALPTLAAVALGVWIDTRWPSRFSWTLMLLFMGIVLGCLNAWYWIGRERSKIEHPEQEDD